MRSEPSRQPQPGDANKKVNAPPDVGDPDFHKKYEEYLDGLPEPSFDERWREQCVKQARQAGRALWFDRPTSLGLNGVLPPEGFTFATADRVATAFVVPSACASTFRDFADVYGGAPIIVDNRERVPLAIFADMRGPARRLVWPDGHVRDFEGVQRSIANSRGVLAVGVDFDDGDTTLDGIMAALEKHGLEGFAHSTFSHTKSKPKHRCIVPLARPYQVHRVYSSDGRPDERAMREAKARYRSLYLGFAKMLGAGTADRSCCDMLRMFRLPAHAPGAAYEHAYVQGCPLNLESVPPFVKPRRYVPAAFESDDARPLDPTIGASPLDDLHAWLRTYRGAFKLASVLNRNGHASEPRDDGGYFLNECPFESGHSFPSPQRTWCVDPDDGDPSGIYCSGKACQRHRREHFDQVPYFTRMVELGWLTESDLSNPTFGGGRVRTRADIAREADLLRELLS